MIDKIGLVCIWVLDQDEALDFYVGKLGFSVYTDVKAEGVRFVLVTAPEQPDVPLMLAVPGPPVMDPATAQQVRTLMAKGFLGPGSLVTKDCRKTTEELRSLTTLRSARFSSRSPRIASMSCRRCKSSSFPTGLSR